MDTTLLDNPAWSALTTVHAPFAQGAQEAKRYLPEVLPLWGFRSRGQRKRPRSIYRRRRNLLYYRLPASPIRTLDRRTGIALRPAVGAGEPPLHATGDGRDHPSPRLRIRPKCIHSSTAYNPAIIIPTPHSWAIIAASAAMGASSPWPGNECGSPASASLALSALIRIILVTDMRSN